MSGVDVVRVYTSATSQVSSPAQQLLDGASVLVPASSVTDMQPAILAALTLGDVYLTPGDYYIGSAIVVPVGSALRGAGSSVVRIRPLATWAPDVSLADDPTNALVIIASTVAAGDATTVSTTTRADSPTLPVSSDAIYSALGYAIVSGNNAGADHYNSSDAAGVIKTEVVQVASKAGNVLTLVDPTAIHHAATTSIKRVTSMHVRPTVSGLTLYASGGTHAVGLLLESVIDPRIYDVGVCGFSRAGVQTRLGCRGGALSIVDLGEVNSALFMSAHVAGPVVRVVSQQGIAFAHAHGEIRGGITLRDRCDRVVIRDSEIRRKHCGIHIKGGTGVTIRDTTIDDVSSYERVLACTESEAAQRYGSAISVNDLNVSTYGEYLHDLVIDNVRITNARSYWDTVSHVHPRQFAVMIEDTYGVHIRGLEICHLGADDPAGVSAAKHHGLCIFDGGTCHIESYHARGIEFPVLLHNAIGGLTAGEIVCMGANGQSESRGAAVTLNVSRGYGRVRIARLVTLGYSSPIGNGEDTYASPEQDVIIDRIDFEGARFQRVVPCKIATGETVYVGDVVQLAASGVDLTAIDHATLTGPGKAVVISTMTTGGWGWVGVGVGGQSVRVTGAVTIGGLLELQATGATNHRMQAGGTTPLAVAVEAGADGALVRTEAT